MDVSIILVSYNTKDLTRNCIKSIYNKTQDVSYDIFVVDNASSDGSSQMIKEEFPDVKLIESPENLGFGRANNLAIKLYFYSVNKNGGSKKEIKYSVTFRQFLRFDSTYQNLPILTSIYRFITGFFALLPSLIFKIATMPVK